MSRHALIDAVDALLPQTQCGKCGFDGCLPYAEAIADGEPINRCPPGGEATLAKLAELTDQPRIPLAEPAQPPLTAVIREDECIGCTKCIQACPVDAILGAAKRMHTVITAECTGCELCVAPCPVDCIDMVSHPAWQAAQNAEEQDAYLTQRAELGRQRHRARQQRQTREAREKRLERRQRRRKKGHSASPSGSTSGGDAALRQKKLAARAAEQAFRRVQQQLSSARRRGDAEAEATAIEQLPNAERLVADAHQALDDVSPDVDPTP